ncbi:hypothetical protein GMMP1_1540017 [Candidatus Magnetomoraceae bacterium gMMP-1]
MRRLKTKYNLCNLFNRRFGHYSFLIIYKYCKIKISSNICFNVGALVLSSLKYC